jgi:phage terminase small subunit
MASRPKKDVPKSAAQQRRALFVDAYLAMGENGTRAYMQVYGNTNPNAAGVQAFRLLRNSKIQQAIEKRRAEIRAKFGLTTDRVMHELGRINYFNPKRLVDQNGKAVPLHQLDDDTAAALASVETIETTVQGKGKDKVVTTRRIKGRPFNKVTALEKSIKILRLYDRPPPPPPDETGKAMTDPRETARRMLFLLARGSAAAEREERPKSAQKVKKIKVSA